MTVLLPTYRRPQQLRETLRGLARQELDVPWEIIVVDNDPAGTARDAVDAASLRVPVRYVVEERSGAAHARNRGIALADGGVIAMIDDDVVAEDGWLSSLAQPVLDGQADVTGGRVRLDPDVPRPRWFDEDVVGRYLTNVDLGGGPRPLGDDEIVVTANAAFRTDLLRRSGGFDPQLGPRGGVQYVSDDVQVLRAVRALGGRAWWVPDAVVVHELPPERLRPSWIVRRAYLQGRSDFRLDRAALLGRRWNGARVALCWLGAELRQRLEEGPARSAVAFHAVTDVARAVGSIVEAASWGR